MKRIAYFAHTGGVSGPNNSLMRLLQALDRTRFEPVVYFPSDGSMVGELSRLGERCRVMPMTQLQKDPSYVHAYLTDVVRATSNVRRAFKRDGIDLVHINTCVTPYPALAARVAGISVVWHVREVLRASRLNDLYLRLVMTLAHTVVAVSGAVCRDLVRRTRVAHNRLVVVHNGIDIASFDQSCGAGNTRAALGLPPDRKLIALPAFLLPRHKGQEVLLQAARILVHDLGLRDIGILLIGDEAADGHGRFTADLKAFCEANDLTEYVWFLGLRHDTPALLAHADVVCVPSSYEDPLPNAVLEAMAAGKPVVATAVGGIPEMVQHGCTGLLVPRNDAKALAAALAELIGDEDKVARMGKAGRERVERDFSAHAHAHCVQSLYDMLLHIDER